MEQTTCKFTPSFEATTELFHEAVYVMVRSTQGLPRVEDCLFEKVENLEGMSISSVKEHEELVEIAKERISRVVMSNSYGPNRLVDDRVWTDKDVDEIIKSTGYPQRKTKLCSVYPCGLLNDLTPEWWWAVVTDLIGELMIGVDR